LGRTIKPVTHNVKLANASNRTAPVILERPWLLFGMVFAAYTLIAIVALWNLLSRIATAVPFGPYTDYHQFLWGFWWIGYAFQHGQSPLWSNYVLFPHTHNMSVHTLAALWWPIYAVLEPLIGYVAAGNILVLLNFPFAGSGMFVWLRRKLGPGREAVVIAFLGGLAFAFTFYLMAHATYMQLNLTPIFWFPVILVLWDEIADPRWMRRPVTAVLLGLALWGLWLSDLEYVIWVPITIGGYSLWTLWVTRKQRRWVPLVVWAIVSIIIMLGLAWIYPLGALLQVRWDPNEFPPAGLGTLRAYSLPLPALIGLAPLFESRTLGRFPVWLAWAAIVLSVVETVRQRRNVPAPNRTDKSLVNAESSNPEAPPTKPESTAKLNFQPSKWLWLVLMLPPIVMALGPDITIGNITIPLPYLALHGLLNGQHRSPSRFTGGGEAMLITFLAVAWAPWFIRLARQRQFWAGAVAVLVALITLTEVGAFSPFPIKVMRDYEIYHQIGQDKREFVIMDIPVGVHHGFTGMGKGQIAMFYGPVHQHPMINGWLSRMPHSWLVYYLNSPLYAWLAGAYTPNTDERNHAAWELDKYTREYRVGYVFVHRDWIHDWLPESWERDWIGWLNMHPSLCPAQISDDGLLVWWRARWLKCDLETTTQILPGAVMSWTAVGPGWYSVETIGGPSARWAEKEAGLRVVLDPNTAYEVTFSAVAFDKERTVTLGSQNWSSPAIAISVGDWRDYTVTIPAGVVAQEYLFLHHNTSDSPAALGQSDDKRSLAVAYRSIVFRPLK
jgi:hypothetical protein